VEKDRTVTLTFYGADMKPVPAQDQNATAIAETKEGKTRIQFEKKGDVLVSKSPSRMETSKKCHHPVYACTCGDD
jgi:hypothetical protein